MTQEKAVMESARRGLMMLAAGGIFKRTELFVGARGWQYVVLNRLIEANLIEKSGTGNNIFYSALGDRDGFSPREGIRMVAEDDLHLSTLIWPGGRVSIIEPDNSDVPRDDDMSQQTVIATLARLMGAMIDKLDRIEKSTEEIKAVLKVLM